MFDFSFITLHRKIINSACFDDADLLKVWIWCLVRANHKDREIVHAGQLIKLKRGDFITGRFEAVKELKTTSMKFRCRIALLEQLGQITRKVTNRYTIISVVNYDYYQGGGKKITNRQPTDNQQKTTDNNVNNVNNKLGDESQKNMSWNKQSEDGDESAIDFETGEIIEPLKEKKKEGKELTARKRELINWLIKYQNRDAVRTNIPKQLKALNRIIEMKVTGAEAQQIIMEQMGSEFWQGKKEKPDFCTVVAIIEKRGE